MLKLHNLMKVYRTDEVETVALNGVNIEIDQGDFVAVMGPSGCGKSTLLNIVGLLDNLGSIVGTRQIALRAGLPTSVAGMTIDRQCSSGLMAVATAAKQVVMDGMDVVVGGGVALGIDVVKHPQRYGQLAGKSLPQVATKRRGVVDGYTGIFVQMECRHAIPGYV